jgi:hypothetical protein
MVSEQSAVFNRWLRLDSSKRNPGSLREIHRGTAGGELSPNIKTLRGSA